MVKMQLTWVFMDSKLSKARVGDGGTYPDCASSVASPYSAGLRGSVAASETLQGRQKVVITIPQSRSVS